MRSASLAALFWIVTDCAGVLARDVWEGVPITGTQIPSGTIAIVKPEPPIKPGPPLSTDKDIAKGVVATESQCKALATALWLRVNGRRFCIRYWISIAGGSKDEALVRLHGDIVEIIDGKIRLSEQARSLTAENIRQGAEQGSQLYRGAYIVIARPGALGSSGNHERDRLTLTEVQVVAAALDALKERHGFKRFNVAGQSGGGHLAAALSQMRDDLHCVVIASGGVSLKSLLRDAGGSSNRRILSLYDPLDHVATMKHQPGRRLIVVSDPDDKVVSYRSQRQFVERVKAKGLPILHVTAKASGKRFHHLQDTAIRLAVDCAKDVDDQALIARYRTKPSPLEEYVVQLWSGKSESETRIMFEKLQTRYPGVLGGKLAIIRPVVATAGGTYYRAQVGSFANADQANELCGKLKAAGGQCLVWIESK